MPNTIHHAVFPVRSIVWLCLLALFITTPTQANEPSADEIFAELLSFAHMANAAYQTEPAIRQTATAQGYTLTHYGRIPAVEVFYFLATNDNTKTQRIAVRGTANVENMLVNLNMQLVADQHTGVRLHHGFARSAEGIYHAVKPHLKSGYRIETTGHSLGGAVALALAMHLDVSPFSVTRVITFGQPKLTNAAGAKAYHHLNITRVVMPKDVIPLVPFLDLTGDWRQFGERADIYWPLGQEILLLKGNDYARLDEWGSLRRTTSFLNEQPSEENLRQHQMQNYLHLIKQKRPGARQVSYQNNFNPLEWFNLN
ncbi:MAG: lipase family protein [Gammaproteobacteria bacterium]|nr:lipase family protein [Gammaproteobacteria bacterium]